MTNYHISDGKAGVCSTTPEKCPIGGSHYQKFEEAQAHAEKAQEKAHGLFHQISKNKITPSTVQSSVHGLKHNSYYGAKIDENAVISQLDALKNHVGEEKFNLLESNKLDRDGEYAFHVTVLSPKETRTLKKQSINIDEHFANDANFTIAGVGSAVDGDKEAWFAIVDSQEIDNIREKFDLPKKDFHVTLGFINGDVHNQPKDSSTLKIV